MDNEIVKAIELNGIVHNATKIGVQDGDCEDLVNLRFKDGSWRASGDGKRVFSMLHKSDLPNTAGTEYTQLYIHTNVYRHILGVNNGLLYWFGDIDTDGVFTGKSTPVALTSVVGDLYICQTGHLLTIIDGVGNFEYYLYKPDDDTYKGLTPDENGSQTSRSIYPFGQIHFNWADAGTAGTITEDKTDWAKWGDNSCWGLNGRRVYINDKIPDTDTLHNEMVTVYGKAKEKNYFTDPFLVCAAIKLYDGKYMYASAPALIFPRQRATDSKNRKVHKNITTVDVDEVQDKWNNDFETLDSDSACVYKGYYLAQNCVISGSEIWDWITGTISGKAYADVMVDLTTENGDIDPDGATSGYQRKQARPGGEDTAGVFRNGASSYHTFYVYNNSDFNSSKESTWKYQIRGVNLCVHIDQTLIDTIKDNNDIFQSLCIFITAPSSVYDMEKKNDVRCSCNFISTSNVSTKQYTISTLRQSVANVSYLPTRRADSDIRYDLLNSPFYLLREYSQDELPNLLKNPVVDLQDPKYKGLLENITQQNRLSMEANSRYTYLPKVQYNYNGRLHIANYTRTQFHGYPLDTFHLNNHALQYKSGSTFKDTLANVASFYDDTLSEERTKYLLYVDSATKKAFQSKGVVSAYITTEIETSDGTQKVCRYIPLTDSTSDFLEQPDALLSFPDSRAKKMTISIVKYHSAHTMSVLGTQTNIPATTTIYSKTFTLTAHPYLNMAYYMTDDLKPATLTTNKYQNTTTDKTIATAALTSHTSPAEERAVETFPNGLKVSSTNNPLYFPVENTYQVGSAEVVAMMSNSISVGTGQTGSASLYIFCKDGVYAMFVDDSGEMAYTNSRVLARDVCNNAKSVTPIDSGVVFTTDRGLMKIAGEQVQEIGQPLEGDWVQFTTQDSIDYSKIAANAYYLNQLASLPDASSESGDSMTQTDFLTYLKGSIINYNHNEYELMVSNPAYNYTYILDKKGNWSRRAIRAEEYVNNYPTSYRVNKGIWYQVDKESDADNSIFLMSHILKMDSIGFKELHRVVARGYWQPRTEKTIVSGTAKMGAQTDGDAFYYLDWIYSKSKKIGKQLPPITSTRANCTYTLRLKNNSQTPVQLCLALKGGDEETTSIRDYWSDICPAGGTVETTFPLVEGNTTAAKVLQSTANFLCLYSGDSDTPIENFDVEYSLSMQVHTALGLYIFGSYDGRKWAMLGGNEKGEVTNSDGTTHAGDFRDIGALVERTDCRFFRFVLAGQVSKDSRFDYFEVSTRASKLNGKIR